MKPVSLFILIAALSPVAALHAHENCTCETTVVATKNEPDAVKRHPLRGVVVDVFADKSALLVKHEEVPGVMKAMTMLLKVDADTLKSPAATKGAAITGLLVRKTDGWWLEDMVLAQIAD